MSKVVVLFEVTPTKEGKARYLEIAAELRKLVDNVEGFISAERFQSLANGDKLLSMSVWEDMESVTTWRNNVEHKLAQQEGMSQLFVSYKISVTSVVKEYSKA